MTTYHIETLCGVQAKFKAQILSEEITKDNVEQWIVEYEAINGITVKIKTKKKPTSGYIIQNYYRCHHDTRNRSPSKDPQQKLFLNPSARVKNTCTKCPFPMVIKIDLKGCCMVDIEWEHNHSVETLEATNFRDISPDCIEKVYKQLSESGHTPSTA